MIKTHLVLKFDPEKSNEEIRKVFADDLARTMWLAIRPGHLASQDFNRHILAYANIIRRERELEGFTTNRLLNILSGVARMPTAGVIGCQELDFAQELFPFVTGEKTITFEIQEWQGT